MATNLFGRGMDIERVNIVFNYDMPEDSDTYLHRVARAGRFGTKGLAITFVSDETDAKTLNDVQDRFDVNIPELPEEIDISSYSESSCSRLSANANPFCSVRRSRRPLTISSAWLLAAAPIQLSKSHNRISSVHSHIR